ncbi:Vegetative incompatibility protein HET-E-1 [Ceratobasidium theobromae]|uniref:Vegetative incompatibility protein HET-E-1 n=1 Tax=Ceratobasidium theobromae TaxID=1582974 RepID=A0A5N5QJW8_9AGAM|nr:Vegetative incompatibility protein HET-E-1 [Ceratobasidium theobromae]
MSNPKRRIRDSLSQKFDKWFRSPSPAAPSRARLSTNDSTNAQAPTSLPNLLSPPTSAQVLPASTTSTPTPSAPPSPSPELASSPAWAGLRTTLQSLHKCAVFPPLKSAISSVIAGIDVIETALKHRDDYEDLASELKMIGEILISQLQQSKSAPMSEFIERTAMVIEEQAKRINDKRDHETGRYLIRANHDIEELARCYRRIEGLFRQLQVNASLSTLNIAEQQLANSQLEGMTPVKFANYDSRLSTDTNRRACTKDTRIAVLLQFNDWSCDPNAPNVYWMSGMAGTGKTTLAYTFCETLKKQKQLGASFFCTRTTAECRDVGRIIPTIAYQLARYSLPFQSALCRILGNDPDISTRTISTQFERLLRDPILEVKRAIPENLIVVVDALDECSNTNDVGSFLEILFRYSTDLPLKLFVTSRPEPGVWQKMQSQSIRTRSVFVLHEIEQSLVQADIELYLTEELESISPPKAQVQKLAELSGSLFIYAATAVRYIKEGRGFGRLSTILEANSKSSKKHAEIDKLYTAILTTALEDEKLEDGEKNLIRLALWTTICAREPVSVETLAALGGVGDSNLAMAALEPLRSVLYVSENGSMVTTLHASFPDFMFDHTRSSIFFCDEAEHNQFLARRCFALMKDQLRFNICDLKSSFVRDRDIEDLDNRIKQFISPALSYACRYWSDHLRQVAVSEELFPYINEFLSDRLLFWMEVMNLKRWMKLGARMLPALKLWLVVGTLCCSPLNRSLIPVRYIQTCTAPSNIVALSEDCRRFVFSFAANPVSGSTPHIYISSLPFCHQSSFVFKNFWKQTRGLIEASGSAIERREAAPLAVWNTDKPANSVVFSPDGTRLAFGTDGNTVTVRDANDGSLVAGPLEGHESLVWSVAFSPDGTHIASGSEDSTILIWSADDGVCVAGPFKGHTNAVMSVTFSPDNARVISGSRDSSVRVWGVQDGILALTPFLGHTKGVNSVAVSPDGARIISGSSDCTIYIWDAHKGTILVPPLTGHSGAVQSVAFSPDGTRIISGSIDRTILIWNTFDGACITSPFVGHSSQVYSVTFSPDGTRIVSGSNDAAVYVWSSVDGTLVTGAFKGHTETVRSVAFSPDGTCIASSSDDFTIHIWAALGNTPSSPQSGHTSNILSVAFSPDGTRIVSGSADHNICIWSANDGGLVAGPMVGHISYVNSVAISPDGTRIASGSDDYSIMIWDAFDGSRIAGPLQGHTHCVMSVSFSPDGTRIVSGSKDTTLCVWSTHDYTLIGDPFAGHTGAVWSVAFSPSGAYIASASNDETVIIWDAFKGTPFTSPLKGHHDAVYSVTFSPDGTRIASCCLDICIWGAHNGNLVAGPFEVHHDYIHSVVYSPDGTCIVFGTLTGIVAILDANNGSIVAGPFEGHTYFVMTVAFSPDGSSVVSGSHDRTIRVWDVHNVNSSARDHPPQNERNDIFATRITVNDDGWVTNRNSDLLFWVPPEVAQCLPVPHNTLAIGRQGSPLANPAASLTAASPIDITSTTTQRPSPSLVPLPLSIPTPAPQQISPNSSTTSARHTLVPETYQNTTVSPGLTGLGLGDLKSDCTTVLSISSGHG